jgi:hypothetical protein
VIEKGSKSNNLQSKQTYSSLSILNYSFLFEMGPHLVAATGVLELARVKARATPKDVMNFTRLHVIR